MKRFHDSIRRPNGMTKRQTVLSLMRVAGYENDSAKFTRLLIENPIAHHVAKEAWRKGRTAKVKEEVEQTISEQHVVGGLSAIREFTQLARETARFVCDGCGVEDISPFNKSGIEHWKRTPEQREIVCGRWVRQ